MTLHMITPLFTPGTKKLEVIHGFWVPEWGVKQDATPGVIGKTVGTTYVKPTRVGTYEVQCTELCGSGHGTMVFKNIHVLTPSAFDDVARRAPRPRPPRKPRPGQGQPRAGGLQRLRLRRLPHARGRQGDGQDGPAAG